MSVTGGYRGADGGWADDNAKNCNRIYLPTAAPVTIGLNQQLSTFGMVSVENNEDTNSGLFMCDSGVKGRRLLNIHTNKRGVDNGSAIEMYGNDDTTSAAGTINLYAGNINTAVQLSRSATAFCPIIAADNVLDLGKSYARWKQVYSASGAINTSDERLKQDIDAIPDAVIAAWGDIDFVQYRWRDAVAEKKDGARYHTGLIAQVIQTTFKKHGLDAQDYGLLCHDQWPETTAVDAVLDENGNVIEPAVESRPAGERWGIRAEECLFMEAERNRRLIAQLYARIEKIEALL